MKLISTVEQELTTLEERPPIVGVAGKILYNRAGELVPVGLVTEVADKSAISVLDRGLFYNDPEGILYYHTEAGKVLKVFDQPIIPVVGDTMVKKTGASIEAVNAQDHGMANYLGRKMNLNYDPTSTNITASGSTINWDSKEVTAHPSTIIATDARSRTTSGSTARHFFYVAEFDILVMAFTKLVMSGSAIGIWYFSFRDGAILDNTYQPCTDSGVEPYGKTFCQSGDTFRFMDGEQGFTYTTRVDNDGKFHYAQGSEISSPVNQGVCPKHFHNPIYSWLPIVPYPRLYDCRAYTPVLIYELPMISVRHTYMGKHHTVFNTNTTSNSSTLFCFTNETTFTVKKLGDVLTDFGELLAGEANIMAMCVNIVEVDGIEQMGMFVKSNTHRVYFLAYELDENCVATPILKASKEIASTVGNISVTSTSHYRACRYNTGRKHWEMMFVDANARTVIHSVT